MCWVASGDASRPPPATAAIWCWPTSRSTIPNATDRADNPPAGSGRNRPPRALERHGLTLLRVHGSLDEIAIFDDFAALLGLGAPAQAEGLAKVYDIPPCTVAALVARVKERTGLRALRVSAPRRMDQTVRRVGLPWGGLGLSVNVAYQERLVEMGCDALIAGESDDMAFAGAAPASLIETSHVFSENLHRCRDALRALSGCRPLLRSPPPGRSCRGVCRADLNL